jgi:hypothetical protein
MFIDRQLKIVTMYLMFITKLGQMVVGFIASNLYINLIWVKVSSHVI